jgi:hypothetical protein
VGDNKYNIMRAMITVISHVTTTVRATPIPSAPIAIRPTRPTGMMPTTTMVPTTKPNMPGGMSQVAPMVGPIIGVIRDAK